MSTRTPTTINDWMRNVEKDINSLKRRSGNGTTNVTLLGAGIGSHAVPILDWNAPEALLNGFYYTAIGAFNTPDDEVPWTGMTVARQDGSGSQSVWNPDTPEDTKSWIRTFAPDPGLENRIIFTDWKRFATPSGYIGYGELDTGVSDDIQQAVQDAADAMDFAEQSNKVFRQDDPPTSTVDYTLRVGDTWFETPDNTPHVWDGDSWEPAQDAAIAGAEAAAAAALAAATDALAEAESAMDFAEAKNRTFRQTSAPANPTGGFPLVTNDIWFDTDDDERIRTWNGSAWVDLALGSNAIGADEITNTHVADDAIQTPQLAANSITAKHTITGAILQTEATASRGVKINSTGLIGYDGSGVTKFLLNATTGALTLTGAIQTGSTIDGAVVTGGTVQTEATASRGIKMNSSGLTVYNSGGTPTMTITASTGAIALLGDLTSGSTVSGATVTGGTVQTEATAARGMKMTSTGMVGYNASGVATFNYVSSTGAVTLTGSIATGSFIDGSTITGGTVQTEATAARGVKMNSSGLTAYDSSGVATFTITASTGAIAMTGGVLSGGSITASSFATASSGQRVEISTSGWINWINSSGTTVGQMVATSTGVSILTPAIYGMSLSNTGAHTISGSGTALTISGGDLSVGTIIGGVTLSGGPTVTGGLTISTGGLNMNTGTINAVATINGGPIINGEPTIGNSTTGGTANVNWNGGKVRAISSLLAHKKKIRPYSVSIDAILSPEPVIYQRRNEGPEWEIGYIVDWVAGSEYAAELEPVLERDAEGALRNFDYYKHGAVMHQIALREIYARVRELEENGCPRCRD